MPKKPVRAKRQKAGQYGIGSVYPANGRWVGSFLAGYNKDGKRRRITVTAPTERECRKALERRRAEVAKDGVPELGANARVSVKAWADRWMDTKADRIRPKTRTAYQSSLNVWIIPTIGHRRITGLTPADVRAVASAITDAGGSSTNALHAHRVLIQLLKAAALEGISVPNRVLLTKGPAKAVNDREAIPLDEVRALLKTAVGDADASRWVAALLQGMRQGECLGLRWSHVDLDAGTIDVSWQLQRLTYADRAAGTFRIPQGYEAIQLHKGLHLVRPKTSSGRRVIPIVAFMHDALVAWRARDVPSPHDLVWPSLITGTRIPAGRPRDPSEDTKAWNDLQKRAGVSKGDRPYLLHEARHSAATLMLEGGVDARTVTELMGHSKIATSRAYMHVSSSLARKALEGGAERLGLTS